MKERSKKKEIVRSVISWILTAFLSVILTVAALVAAFGLSFGSDSARLQAATDVEYVAKLRAFVSEEYAATALTTGVPKELSDRFANEYVTADLALFPILHFEEGAVPDLADFEATVLADIRALAKEMEERGELVFSSEEERAELDESLVSLSETYTVELRNAVQLRRVYSKAEYAVGIYRNFLVYLIPGLALLFLVGAALLFPINRKNPFPYFYAAFGSAGILCVAVPGVMIARDFLKNLALDPVYVRDWLAELVHRFLWATLTVGLGYLAVAILFGAISLIRRKKLREREQKKIRIDDPLKEGLVL